MIQLKSYTPYSGIEETCFVSGESGVFYPCVRVENISFPLTISTIRSAVCSCLANGDQPSQYYPILNRDKSDLNEYWIEEFNLEVNCRLPDNFNLFNPLNFKEPSSEIADILKKLCENAITIHSGFPVSALLKTDSGYISGVNVEVSSWSMGLCAERVAISRAISHGIKNLEMMFVYAPKSNFISPCGSCRQFLMEFMPDKTIHLYHRDQGVTKHFIQHLLPNAITSDSLKQNL